MNTLINLDERVKNMTDDEICGILLDKSGWQENVYARALLEAKERNIGMEVIQAKQEEVAALKFRKASEGLTWKEKIMFMCSFVFFPAAVLVEGYRMNGQEEKLKQAKFYALIGKPIIGGAVLLAVLMFFYFRHLLEPSY